MPGGSAPLRDVREHDLQEAGLEDRDARSESAGRAHVHLVDDLRERVGVHELARRRQSVGPGAAEVDRTGVERGLAHEPHVVEQLHVAVPVGDRLAEPDGRVADDARMLFDRGPVRGRVLRGRFLGADDEIGRVRVDDGRARVDARERVLGVLLDGCGHVRIAAAAGHAVERDLDHYGRVVLHSG